MNLLQAVRRHSELESRYTIEDYAAWFAYNGAEYPLGGLQMTLQGDTEEIAENFVGYVQSAYRRNGVVFACMLVRLMVFSEARFQFRQLRNGRPGDLFGTQALSLLENPWPNGATGDLLARAIQDADLAGNFFGVRRAGRQPFVRRMRPDWVSIVIASPNGADDPTDDLDAEVIGYLYHPGGKQSGKAPVTLDVADVTHFAPIPDPAANWRGMSWLTPVVREISADTAATKHKLKFFENGATPNMMVKFAPEITETQFEDWVRLFKKNHEGAANAYKTLFIGGGADATVVGADMKQLDFKVTQGAGETRIAAAAGVPPVIVGLSEGLQGSSLNAGNYGQARRRFADGTLRPLWRNASASFSSLVEVPPGAELWYDDRDIPFLQEDQKDAAEILAVQSSAIRTLVDGGYRPDAVIAAVANDDLSLLAGQHTNLLPVQLQPPGSGDPEDDDRSLLRLLDRTS